MKYYLRKMLSPDPELGGGTLPTPEPVPIPVPNPVPAPEPPKPKPISKFDDPTPDPRLQDPELTPPVPPVPPVPEPSPQPEPAPTSVPELKPRTLAEVEAENLEYRKKLLAHDPFAFEEPEPISVPVPGVDPVPVPVPVPVPEPTPVPEPQPQPKPQPTPVVVEPQEYVDEATFEAILTDRSKLNEVLHKVVVAATASGAQQALQGIDGVIDKRTQSYVESTKTIDSYFAANQDLIDHRDMVENVTRGMLEQRPGLKSDPQKVLGMAGAAVRKAVRGGKPTPGFAPTGGGQPAPQGVPEATGIQAEMDATFGTDRWKK